MNDYDYEGYAIRYGVKQPDGTIVLKDAFRHYDGESVPLVYNFYQNGGTHIPDISMENVLGIACLENREDGIYARCILYDTPICSKLRECGLENCIKGLTLYAGVHRNNEREVKYGNIQAVKVISK